jgi:hypothetical protein
MAKIISASKFDTTIGPVSLTGVLFLADPRSDSFATGDAEILGHESVNFEVRLEDPLLEIRLSSLMVTITFDIDTTALLGKVKADKEQVSEGDDWTAGVAEDIGRSFKAKRNPGMNGKIFLVYP